MPLRLILANLAQPVIISIIYYLFVLTDAKVQRISETTK